MICKGIGPMSDMWKKPRHTACRISNKNCLSEFGFINFDPPQNEFHIMFNTFVNMFWRAEGFGYMWVPFEFGSLNN